ncbi:hypothetical protein ACFVU3_24715 [Streptomyces sp. NPDC058052]|uniref:hypothetical protein n=1 Tax=Streptomyces sp. NPDC058052 TaxID=3346316 RepID=UPI0036E828C3
MKIRRILATAVAAAVTTPVVFLSAGQAVADTPKPPQKQTAGAAGHEDDDAPTIEELEAAVEAAQAKVDDLEERRAKLLKQIDENEVDEALTLELAAATEAVETAKTAVKDAEAKLTAARKAVEELTDEATPEERQEAEEAVTAAEEALTGAQAGLKAAETRQKNARKAIADVSVELTEEYDRLGEELETAEDELATAEDDLEFWKTVQEGCKEDASLSFSLTGPEKIEAGGSGIFTLSLSNVSDRDLDEVQAFPGAALFDGLDEDGKPLDREDLDEPLDHPLIEWSSKDVLEWTPLTDEFDAAEFGGIDKGHTSQVKLRITVDGDTRANLGTLNSGAMYWNEDGSCGISDEVAGAWFDVTGGEKAEPTPTEKPTATATPEPSPSTATPAPAATSDHTTQQGGSSNTAVSGTLAETGAGDAMPRLAAAAGAAVALGAGALFLARRRRANA